MRLKLVLLIRKSIKWFIYSYKISFILFVKNVNFQQAFKAWAKVKTEEAKVVFKDLMEACDKSLEDPGCLLENETVNEDSESASIPWSKG